MVAGAAVVMGGLLADAPAYADAVADAKAAVAKYAGPQTTWEGPTKAPKPVPGKKVVFLSGDEQNDISHLYGVYIKEAAKKLGWSRDGHRRQGQPDLMARRHESGDRAQARRHRHVRRRGEPAGPDQGGRRRRASSSSGLHAAGLPGPQPDLALFVNIQEDPREIGKAEADWAIADSNGKANVVVLSHNEYAIAKVKSMATKDEIEKCPGCKVARLRQFARVGGGAAPAAADDELGAALRPAALRDLGRRQRFGLRGSDAAAPAASIPRR